MRKIIGIAGGIGSGKSAVSRILRLSGQEVVDCDLLARWLMETDSEIKALIRDRISPEVTDGHCAPDRTRLAQIVFSQPDMRLVLNGIVHHRVRKAIERISQTDHISEPLWVEAALMVESGLADICYGMVVVVAPEDIRVKRICQRDSCDCEQALRKIWSQQRENEMLQQSLCKKYIINNNGEESLLNAVARAMRFFNVNTKQ